MTTIISRVTVAAVGIQRKMAEYDFPAGVALCKLGVQPGALLMTLTCFGKTENSGFAESIVYAADHGAAISQNSWSYAEPGVYDKSVHDAIDYFNANASSRVIADGGLVIFAAGNGGSDNSWPHYSFPALDV